MALLQIAEPGQSAEPHRHRLATQLGAGQREDGAIVVFRGVIEAMQAVKAHVVVAALEHGVAQGATDEGFKSRGHHGQIPLHQLALQREGRGRDHDRSPGRRGRMQGGGRKVAIQILEFFDRTGYTRRVRDEHMLRRTGAAPQWQTA